MDNVNKVLISALILLALGLFVSLAQAGGNVSVTNISVNYDCISYDGVLDIENIGNENITVVIVIYVDSNRTLERAVALNIKYFKGFRLRTLETVEFEALCEEGNHEVHVTVIADNMLLLGNVSYISQGCIKDIDEEEEEEEEEIDEEDWLPCP
jgi:hypothetical protein